PGRVARRRAGARSRRAPPPPPLRRRPQRQEDRMTEQPATSRTETPMAEQRLTVGDQITVVVTGEMTGITPDGTPTVQYPSSLGACETHVELEDTSVVVMHERDADKATPVLIEERDSARAEVKRLRAERTIDLEALRVAAADLKHAR